MELAHAAEEGTIRGPEGELGRMLEFLGHHFLPNCLFSESYWPPFSVSQCPLFLEEQQEYSDN